MPCPAARRFAPVLALSLALLGTTGCVFEEEVDGLYVFDNASRRILIWSNPDELLAAARDGKQPPKPARTLRSQELAGANLAWGGMALDSSRKRLYLVTERGTVYVVLRPGTLDGELKGKDQIISFRLKGASNDELPGRASFGQAAVDGSTDTLYVMENGRDSARVWHVPNASRVADGATVTSQGNTSRAGEDRRGVGVAAGSAHQFYALFGAGDRTDDGVGRGTGGPRLRLGEHKGDKAPAFHARTGNRDHHLLAGDATLLTGPTRYGSLAYDDSRHCVYVLAGPQPEKDPPGILVFNAGQFFGTMDQAPVRRLGNLPADLRIIAHPTRADWLAAAAAGPAGGRDADRNPKRRKDRDPARDGGRDKEGPKDKGGHKDKDGHADRDGNKDKDGRADQDGHNDKDRPGDTSRDRDRDRDGGDDREEAARRPDRDRNLGGGPGGATLYLWKEPSHGGEPAKLTTLAPGIAIRGLAFGDN